MKQIILTKGENKKQSKITDDFYLSKLRKNTKMLYIPIALKDYISFEDYLSWISNIFLNIKDNI